MDQKTATVVAHQLTNLADTFRATAEGALRNTWTGRDLADLADVLEGDVLDTHKVTDEPADFWVATQRVFSEVAEKAITIERQAQ